MAVGTPPTTVGTGHEPRQPGDGKAWVVGVGGRVGMIAVGTAVGGTLVGGMLVGGTVVGGIAVGATVGAAAVTTMVPFMNVWILQWYAYVPACVKVLVNVFPEVNMPESQELGDPPISDVAVWAVAPWLDHVNDVPTGTVIVPGEN